jgi:hypothetical protein
LAKPEDVFNKLRKLASETPSERRAAKEASARENEQAAKEAGSLLTSGIFGTSTIEIFEGGFVRLAIGAKSDQAPARIGHKTPFEKLRSIKYAAPSKDSVSDEPAPIDGLISSTLSTLIKGGTNIVKATGPGLAAAGVAHFANAESRRAYLVISTDRGTYSLTNESHNGFMTKTNEGHKEVGAVLEQAGFTALGIASDPPVSETRVDESAHGTETISESDISIRLRELAKLHRDGILSDNEFANAKAKLIAGL